MMSVYWTIISVVFFVLSIVSTDPAYRHTDLILAFVCIGLSDLASIKSYLKRQSLAKGK